MRVTSDQANRQESKDRKGMRFVAFSFILMIVLSGTFVLSLSNVDTSPAQTPPRPNIVVIMTDDQDTGSMRVLSKAINLIGGSNGTTFNNFFASFSFCCPSRATFITGQYSHNHGVEDNVPPYGGYGKLDHSNTLPVWLQAVGYYTIHVGKWLNGYGIDNTDQTEVPPGWSDWQGLVDPSTYAMDNYTINDNGTLVTYGNTNADYQTDVLADRAVAVINERAGQAKPFFLSIATLAPHGESALPGQPPPRSAPRHQGFFGTEPLPKAPSFNEADVSDKPAFIRNLPSITVSVEQGITTKYRARLGSLLAVDDLVERVVNALAGTGQLDNTVIFFTSDNGFMYAGQHRLRGGKIHVYEESVRVPLLVRGGGFPKGVTVRQLAANVDLAPTIVELTGATPGRTVDGQSLLPLALDPNAGLGRNLLLETGPVVVKSLGVPLKYKALRSERYVYVEHSTGEKELYDLQVDPYQLTSLHNDSSYNNVKSQLQTRLSQLRICSGSSCILFSTEPSPSPPPTTSVTCAGKTATIVGNGSNNVLTGTGGPDVIAGQGGGDTIDGLGGNDIICGGSGNDTIKGDDGVDKIYGQGGSDMLYGDNGNDIVNGGSGNDNLNGGAGDDQLIGGDGDDIMNGGTHVNSDTCNGGAHVSGDSATECENVSSVP